LIASWLDPYKHPSNRGAAAAVAAAAKVCFANRLRLQRVLEGEPFERAVETSRRVCRWVSEKSGPSLTPLARDSTPRWISTPSSEPCRSVKISDGGGLGMVPTFSKEGADTRRNLKSQQRLESLQAQQATCKDGFGSSSSSASTACLCDQLIDGSMKRSIG